MKERQKDFKTPSDSRDMVVESVELVVWAAIRAYQSHPEWGQATLQWVQPKGAIIDELAAILVEGTPVERMAV